MLHYSKSIIAMLGALAAMLVDAGVIDVGQSDSIVQGVLLVLTAFGVYQVPNGPKALR